MENISQSEVNNNNITEENVKRILSQFDIENREAYVNYSVRNASDNMLGFLADYWRLEVRTTVDKNVLCFFIKAISRSNLAKAVMVRELRLFEKETLFYSVIKKNIEISDLKPWSAKFITLLDDAMVFEDLNVLQYKLRYKFKRFDVPHTLQALKTLARFHASSLIFEEKMSKELNKPYSISDDFTILLEKSGYHPKSPWFQQCMNGALEALRKVSTYNLKKMAAIESSWADIWSEAVNLGSDFKQKRVICHRDLWNNNILFKYKKVSEDNFESDDCVFVDFQAIEYEPPASDVMLLLYCNLEPKLREDNMSMFLTFYYEELEAILINYGYSAEYIMSKEEFFKSAELHRKWGLVACSCLMPQFWIADDLTKEIFCDTQKFNEILTQNKAAFITTMMLNNSNYKEKVMEIFEEIVERYCV